MAIDDKKEVLEITQSQNRRSRKYKHGLDVSTIRDNRLKKINNYLVSFRKQHNESSMDKERRVLEIYIDKCQKYLLTG